MSKSLIFTDPRETDHPTESRHLIETGICKQFDCDTKTFPLHRLGESNVYFSRKVGGARFTETDSKPNVGPPRFVERLGDDPTVLPVFPWERNNERAHDIGLQRILKQVYSHAPKRIIRQNHPSGMNSTIMEATTTSTKAADPSPTHCTMMAMESLSCNYSVKHAFCSLYGFNYCLISEKSMLLDPPKFVCVYEKDFTPEPTEKLFFKIRCSSRRKLFVSYTT